jgi:hypothetical protein
VDVSADEGLVDCLAGDQKVGEAEGECSVGAGPDLNQKLGAFG